MVIFPNPIGVFLWSRIMFVNQAVWVRFGRLLSWSHSGLHIRNSPVCPALSSLMLPAIEKQAYAVVKEYIGMQGAFGVPLTRTQVILQSWGLIAYSGHVLAGSRLIRATPCWQHNDLCRRFIFSQPCVLLGRLSWSTSGHYLAAAVRLVKPFMPSAAIKHPDGLFW